MTDFSTRLKPDQGQPARTIHILNAADFSAWRAQQSQRVQMAVQAAGFSAQPDRLLILPGDDPAAWQVALGVTAPDALSPWCLAAAAENLPAETYRLITARGEPVQPGAATLGWLLAQHHFNRFKSKDAAPVQGARVLLTTQIADIAGRVAEAKATAWVRDLVNLPANECSPALLEAEAAGLAKDYDAQLTVTRGDALAQGYPLIHAVGQAAHPAHAPRLIELEWGNPGYPRIAIIGKGVCFDTGGLDIKSAGGMKLMKKDMGGAAHALALAQLIMTLRLKIRLHLLIPAVENAISGNAMRPGDILRSRNGLFIEVDNTDAEGRLILADALTKAGEDGASLILDFATLTGAARVALGPDLPAMFSNDEALAATFLAAAQSSADPLWRLPLWQPYQAMLKSTLADTLNAGESGFAGAVTAALFLQKFVPPATPWVHLDTYAWNASVKPGRPKGGEALGLRASLAALSVL